MPVWLTQLLGGGIIDKILSFIPNPAEAAKAKEQLQAALLEAAINAESEQRQIDKTEAANPSVFVAGWRPAVGWLCVFGLGWQFFFSPILTWLIAAFNIHTAPLPLMGDATLTDLLYAMLGVASLRTADKMVGGSAVTKAVSFFGKK